MMERTTLGVTIKMNGEISIENMDDHQLILASLFRAMEKPSPWDQDAPSSRETPKEMDICDKR